MVYESSMTQSIGDSLSLAIVLVSVQHELKKCKNYLPNG